MSAPILWIFMPMLIGGFLLLIGEKRMSSTLGGIFAFLLAVIAFFIPIDTAMLLGAFSFKIAPGLQIFGRNFIINQNDGPFLAILYGMAALWFFGSEAAGRVRRLPSLGLSFIALLVASIAVEPFLYAALTIEIAVLIALPMLVSTANPPGRGAIRFLIYQTLAMPFILFSGWLLAGVEASPSDLTMAIQSTVMLALGFAFLFAIFPLYSWIPLLAQESSPYIFGFILWALPTITTIFLMGFLDRYSWLRSSPEFPSALYISGVLMVTTGGVWAAFQRNLARLMGYASIVETGLSLLALGIAPQRSISVVFMLMIPRGISMLVWSLSLSILKERYESLTFTSIQGSLRNFPVASAGVILANLSVAGLALLAGFPPRLALWEGLASFSLSSAFWLGLGSIGLLMGAVRTLAVMAMADENITWTWRESLFQSTTLAIGIIGLFILGIFPQSTSLLTSKLPLMFIHLGQ